MKRSSKSGVVLSSLVALVPVGLWLVFHPASSSFIGLQSSIDAVAKLLGLIGVSLFAWNLILSARISWLEKRFGGLDKLYRAHHTIGGLAFIAMLVHPMLLTIKYATVSLVSAYLFILPSLSDWGLLAGKTVLVGMVVILFITFYVYVSHERFVWIHRLTGLLFAIAVYHFLFVAGSDVRSTPALYVYLLTLSAVALVLYAYRSIFGRSLKPRYRYTVRSVKDLGGAHEIILSPPTRPMQYTPGQFSFLTFISPELVEQTHPFSISSGDNEAELRYTIKELGDFTSQLGVLKAGDKVFVEGPYGSFSYRNMPRPDQVWVAGGIGITPFLSMARSIQSDEDYRIHLFYSVADNSQAYMADELAALAKTCNGRLKFTLHNSQREGYLTAKHIEQAVPHLVDCEILLCGPKVMMSTIESQCLALGVEAEHIQYEAFALL